MKTTRHTCEICKREYEFEHGGDKGYSTDNICGPFCDGLRRGRREADALRADAACWRREAEAARVFVSLDACKLWYGDIPMHTEYVDARAATDQRFPDGVPGATP